MQDGSLPSSGIKPNEKALLARIWGDFDTRYMKPLLTHSRPTLLETLPVCCTPLARILTTTQQMTQVWYMILEIFFICRIVKYFISRHFYFRMKLLEKQIQIQIFVLKIVNWSDEGLVSNRWVFINLISITLLIRAISLTAQMQLIQMNLM